MFNIKFKHRSLTSMLYGNKTFFEGKIRELYPINILNEKHLNFKLNNNQEFKNFINGKWSDN